MKLGFEIHDAIALLIIVLILEAHFQFIFSNIKNVISFLQQLNGRTIKAISRKIAQKIYIFCA